MTRAFVSRSITRRQRLYDARRIPASTCILCSCILKYLETCKVFDDAKMMTFRLARTPPCTA